jgi:translocator protein
MHKTVKLIISVLLPVAVGATAGFFTASGVKTWYLTIQKPWFNPPNWIFAPVWTALYVVMGIALYLVWRLPASAQRRTALILFGCQLLVNFLWSFLFFYLHQPGLAFAEIILMWLLILLTIFQFAKLSKPAAWLLVPYITWVSFATILNGTIWWLNG